MRDGVRTDRGPSRRILAIAGWTAVVYGVALILRAQDDLPLSRALLSTAAWYYSLGVLVWLACTLDARWGIWRRSAARALVVHAAIGLVAIAVWTAFVIAWSRMTIGPAFWGIVFGDWWMFQLLTTAMVYAAGVGIGLIVQGSDREGERQAREARLEALAREAELTAIKAQLQPHFLFNALNSILALIDHDPAEARRMLTRLSSLLHSVFDRLDEPLVPLDRELETIRDYLDIERIRFGDRLTFSIDASREARAIPVPPFLLQPIVENAVKHGIEPHGRPGAVRVAGEIRGARLCLSVADTGTGMNGVSSGHGRGLTLTRRRLQTAYGPDETSLRIEQEPGGCTVRLELPVATDGA